jgi:photosystem II stability/assembly factor-like uncharacterized protein
MAAITLTLCALAPSYSAPPSHFSWKSVTIGGGGYVLDVYCHPKQKDLVYIRTDVGGFYRWDAKTPGWIPLTDMFDADHANYYGGEGMALDPSDPKIVYIAAGMYDWSRGTIFKSTDQGLNWRKLPIDLPMGGNEDDRWGGERLAASQFHPKVLLFGSRKNGLWRSADGGDSWTQATSAPAGDPRGYGVCSIAFDQKKSGTAYAAVDRDAVYQSPDEGATWTKMPGSPNNVIRLASSRDGGVYATTGKGVLHYDLGAWTDITPADSQHDGGFNGISIDPRDSNDIICVQPGNSLRLYRSRDKGTHWELKKYTVSDVPPWYSPSMRQIQQTAGLTFDPLVPGRVWMTDWYAAYHTDNIDADTMQVTATEHGHEELVVFDLLSPIVGPTLISGTADVDGFVHRDLNAYPTGLGSYYGGNGPTFGDTTQIAECVTSPARLAKVSSNRWNTDTGVAVSDDSGAHWTPASGWSSKEKPQRVAISPTNPNNIVVVSLGTAPVQWTSDNGKTWKQSSGLPAVIISGDVWNWQFPLVADGAQVGTFYIYAGSALYKSVDGGQTFARTASGFPGYCQSLVSVPGVAGDIWFTAGEGGPYHSTDFGATFIPLDSVKSAKLFALGKRSPGSTYPALYLYGALKSGAKGIFQSIDGGATWSKIDDPRMPIGDTPNCMTASLQTYGLVFVGTNGRGIFQAEPGPISRSGQAQPVPLSRGGNGGG